MSGSGPVGRVVLNHLGHVVADLARARRFYEEVLGFELWRELRPDDASSAKLLGLTPPLGSTIVYLRRDGFVLELIHYAAPEHQHPPRRRAMDDIGFTHLSFSCDVESAKARVEERSAMIQCVATFYKNTIGAPSNRSDLRSSCSARTNRRRTTFQKSRELRLALRWAFLNPMRARTSPTLRPPPSGMGTTT